MKYFPVKTVLFCIIVLPFLHMGSLALLEDRLENFYRQRLENTIVADSKPLLEGSIPLEEMVARNVKNFKSNDFLIHQLGLDVDIRVTVRSGTIIYPFYDYLVDSVGKAGDPRETARHNYTLLEQGFDVRVIVRVGLDSPIAILILGLYCVLGCLVFFAAYRIGHRKALKDQAMHEQKLSMLMADQARHREVLTSLENEKKDLMDSLKKLQDRTVQDQKKASEAEEELIDEILSLEEKLKANVELQEASGKELSDLREKLEKADRRKGSNQKRKNFDLVEKRFGVLYKNLEMNRKAMTGFFELDPELQIKAEEVIHQLNEDSSKVIVKRKVFAGKKNKSISFEVLFAYTGRLYFRQTEANRTEILVIGTKNTQDRDMEFLHNL
ncbi:MAG: hypothetical protein V1793_12160 [Pseudomonadota bacterium]